MNTVSFVYLILVIQVSGSTGYQTDGAFSSFQNPTDRSVKFMSLLRNIHRQSTDKTSNTGITGATNTNQPDPPIHGNNMTADALRDTTLFPDSKPLRMDPFDALPADPPASHTSSRPSDSPVPDTNPSNPSVSGVGFSFSSTDPSGSSVGASGTSHSFSYRNRGTQGYQTDGAFSSFQNPADRSVKFKSILRNIHRQSADKTSNTGITGATNTKQPDPPIHGNNMTADVLRDTRLFPDSRPLRMDPFDALPADPPASHSSSKPSDSPVPDTNPSNPSVSSVGFSFSSTDPSGSSVGASGTSHSFSYRNRGTQGWLSEKFATKSQTRYLASPQEAYSSSFNHGPTSYQRGAPQYSSDRYQDAVRQPVDKYAPNSYHTPTMTSSIYSNFNRMFNTLPTFVQVVTKAVPNRGDYASVFTSYRTNGLPQTGTTREGHNRFQPTRSTQMFNTQQNTGGYNYMDYTKCDKTCTNFCMFGYETDSNACSTCTCKRPASVMCLPPICSHVCPFGAERNALGCDTCKCKSNAIIGAFQKYLRTRLLDFSALFTDNEM